MAGNLGDYLKHEADRLDTDRADVLIAIQAELDKRYPGQTRAIGLHQRKLRVIAPSASVAADLRLRQLEFLAAVRTTITAEAVIEKLIIQIRSL